MPFPLLPFIILLLPFLEIYLAISWLIDAPLWALLYFTAVAILGILFIKMAKISFAEAFHMAQDENLSSTLLVGAFRWWAVGLLLLFPGYLTDILAAIILFFPFSVSRVKTKNKRADDGIIDAEAEIIDDEQRD